MLLTRFGTVQGLRLVVMIALTCFAVAGVAEPTPAPVPKLEGWVTDTASVLSVADRSRLSGMLNRYHRETNHQLAVLTVPTLGGETIEAFSFRVAESWRLGYKGLDNGILVTLSMKERRVRIELGTGMERYVSDLEAKSIIVDVMTPAFREGDFAGGLERGLSRLMEDARRFVVKPGDLPAVAVGLGRASER